MRSILSEVRSKKRSLLESGLAFPRIQEKFQCQTTVEAITSCTPMSAMGHPVPVRQQMGFSAKRAKIPTVGYGDTAVRLKETKGFAYIAHLLRHPRTEFHVLDLVGVKASGRDEDEAGQRMVGSRRSDADLQKAGIGITRLGDAGEVLDQQAKSAYRRRLSELRRN